MRINSYAKCGRNRRKELFFVVPRSISCAKNLKKSPLTRNAEFNFIVQKQRCDSAARCPRDVDQRAAADLWFPERPGFDHRARVRTWKFVSRNSLRIAYCHQNWPKCENLDFQVLGVPSMMYIEGSHSADLEMGPIRCVLGIYFAIFPHHIVCLTHVENILENSLQLVKYLYLLYLASKWGNKN